MFSKLILPYRGLSQEIWYLALITLINRAGAMVIPFLSLYLTKHLGFNLSDVGWIMSAYGAGSALGTFFGGKLTDRFGFQKVMQVSLTLTGFLFFGMQWLESYHELLIGIFLLSLSADTYRPAIWVAMDVYSKPANKTRSVTLIRLAINLGFSAGPAIGGFIIAYMSYAGLFWVDGTTTLLAAFFLWLFLKPKKMKDKKPEENLVETKILASPYRDYQYLMFCFAIMLMGVVFVQFFSTMPVFFNQIIGLNENHIGLLLAGNGFIIFLFEMPLISYLEKKKRQAIFMTFAGSLFFIVSFLVLNIGIWVLFPILSILFITIGEMISFPYSNTYAMERSNKGKKGAYMALYTLTFSFAHLIGPNLGLHISEHYGFAFTWYLMAFLMLFSVGILYSLHRYIQKNTIQ